MNNRGKIRFRKLRKTTCFGIGVAGAVCGIIGAALMIAGVGPADYATTAAYILYGTALLLLGTQEKGGEKRGKRTKLLMLFFMLVVGNLPLPLLEWMMVPVLPLLALMYKKPGDGPFFLLLLAAEIAMAVVQSLSIMEGWLGRNPLLVMGIAVGVVSLVRGVVLLRLLLRVRLGQPGAEDEPEVHSLR